MAGRHYDEWRVGDRIVHEIRRTVTETDNLLFSTMTHNPQPLHLDAEAAKASEFGRIIVNGTFTVPGDGDINFAALLDVLMQAGYQGWLVVEAEQDPAVAPSYAYAKKGYETLRALLAAAQLHHPSEQLPEHRSL